MGLLAFAMIVVGALVIGAAGMYVGHASFGYEWAVTAIAAAIGGYVAGSMLGPLSMWGPEIDSLFVIPALIGGIVLGAVVAFVLRLTAEPSRT